MFCKHCFAPNLIKCGFDEGRQRYECNVCGHKSVYVIENLELIQENVRLAKQKQSAQDKNRIQNKSFREYARVENAVSVYNKQLIKLFDKYKLSTYTQKHSEQTSCVGVIHVSEILFNELVDLPHNKYDFTVASKRCKHFVNQATKYFKAFGVTNVLMVQSGDLLNSDRRLDELLNMATNRAKATFLAVDILQQVIMDLNSNFNVSVTMVTGNESRVKKDWGWSGNIASDNYDYTIFQTLRYIFKDTDITFVDGDPTEVVVEVAGQNLLVLHGNGSIKKGIDTSITQLMGRYRARGIDINYVIFGHIHSARVGDNFSRSSSMVGANDYSEKALNLSGRASQNCYIFYDNGNRDGIKVDLQNYTDDMYDIEKSLESYNAKSHEKLNVGKTIFKVVV